MITSLPTSWLSRSLGVEVLPSLARAWRSDHAHDGDRVIADFGQSNAHNTPDRVAFMQRAHAVIPGAAC